jgi:GGDEF domain-containing protein
MGRLRYAYLTSIVSQVGTVAGIMAIDVGWLDELLANSNLLRQRIGLSALAIFMIVALGGALVLHWQLRPLNRLARFAHHIAEGGSERDVPFTRRPDEIGQLTIGLDRVADMQDKMTALAYTDTVTGLGNRARYLVDLDRALAGADRQAASLALLMLDLDHFK